MAPGTVVGGRGLVTPVNTFDPVGVVGVVVILGVQLPF